MKALSLKQPFAELILQGRKTIELRKWNTSFRGPFYIHASKTPDTEAMKRFGFSSLPTGQLVGKAMLVEVKHYQNEAEHKADQNKHCGSSAWGAHGFVLSGIERISPIPLKGKLNFFETNLNP